MLIISYLKEKLKTLRRETVVTVNGTMNAGLRLAVEALDILDALRWGWGAIPDRARLTMVHRARAKLADAITLKLWEVEQDKGDGDASNSGT